MTGRQKSVSLGVCDPKLNRYPTGLPPILFGQSGQLHLDQLCRTCEKFSHDALNRYLAGERLPPKLTWENVKGQVIQTPTGFLVFDDTVADKNYSHEIELVRRQYSGNAHAVIKGIGIVTCVYVNPDLDQFWIIDY